MAPFEMTECSTEQKQSGGHILCVLILLIIYTVAARSDFKANLRSIFERWICLVSV